MLTTSFQTRDFRARADREVTVLVAEANSRSEGIRGEGDAERNSIFAAAFNRDRDFFAFYRTIQAYQKGFTAEDTRMLLRPNTESFNISAVKREGLKAIQHRSSLQENHVPRGAARPARPDGDVGHGSLNRPMSHARQEMSVLVDKWRSGARRRAR